MGPVGGCRHALFSLPMFVPEIRHPRFWGGTLFVLKDQAGSSIHFAVCHEVASGKIGDLRAFGCSRVSLSHSFVIVKTFGCFIFILKRFLGFETSRVDKEANVLPFLSMWLAYYPPFNELPLSVQSKS